MSAKLLKILHGMAAKAQLNAIFSRNIEAECIRYRVSITSNEAPFAHKISTDIVGLGPVCCRQLLVSTGVYLEQACAWQPPDLDKQVFQHSQLHWLNSGSFGRGRI